MKLLEIIIIIVLLKRQSLYIGCTKSTIFCNQFPIHLNLRLFKKRYSLHKYTKSADFIFVTNCL